MRLNIVGCQKFKNIKNTEKAIKILKNGKKNTESSEPRLEALIVGEM